MTIAEALDAEFEKEVAKRPRWRPAEPGAEKVAAKIIAESCRDFEKYKDKIPGRYMAERLQKEQKDGA